MRGEKFKNGLDCDSTNSAILNDTLTRLKTNPFYDSLFGDSIKAQTAISLTVIAEELTAIRKELHEMNTNQHFVDFTMCTKCQHKDVDLNEEPCFTCLGVAAREDGSRKPVKFEEKEEKK